MVAATTDFNSTEVIVAGTADLWTAPVGTSAPTSPVAPPNTPWIHAGYSTEDGTSFASAPTFQEVRAHQSSYPVRRFKSADTATLNVVLEQWKKDNFKLAFGGGTVTVTSSIAKYSPPGPAASTPMAALLYIVDGSLHYLFVVPSCRIVSGVTTNLNKTSNANLPIALDIEGATGADPWYMLTDDVTGFPADA